MDSHFHGNDKSGGGNNRGEIEIAALSSKARNDRGIKTNNIYLQTVVKGTILLTTPHSNPYKIRLFTHI